MGWYAVVIPYTEPTYKSPDHVYSATIEVRARSKEEAQDLALQEFQRLAELSWARYERKLIRDQIRVEPSGAEEGALFSTRTEELAPRTAVLHLEGVLDAEGNREFAAALRELETSGYSQAVIDLSGLEHINSSGLGSLVEASQRLEIRLAGPQPRVYRVMEMAGLHVALGVFPTREEALRSLSR